jgi:chemosensory pili system protein ChpC
MADSLPRDIRGVMIPVTGARLLLPNATVAEVVAYAAPEKIPAAPAWLLGRLTWRGWSLPLFSFTALCGDAAPESVADAKVAVLKALGGNPKLPFVAMLTQGFPRLTTILPDTLVAADGDAARPAGVRAHVLMRSDHAIIPDLNAIEWLVAEAIAG